MRRATPLKKPFRPKVMSVAIQKREATKFAKSFHTVKVLRILQDKKALTSWAKHSGIPKALLISALKKRINLV